MGVSLAAQRRASPHADLLHGWWSALIMLRVTVTMANLSPHIAAAIAPLRRVPPYHPLGDLPYRVETRIPVAPEHGGVVTLLLRLEHPFDGLRDAQALRRATRWRRVLVDVGDVYLGAWRGVRAEDSACAPSLPVRLRCGP